MLLSSLTTLVGLRRQQGGGTGTVGLASSTGRALRRFEAHGRPGGGAPLEKRRTILPVGSSGGGPSGRAGSGGAWISQEVAATLASLRGLACYSIEPASPTKRELE
jgi:hypothetical protein